MMAFPFRAADCLSPIARRAGSDECPKSCLAMLLMWCHISTRSLITHHGKMSQKIFMALMLPQCCRATFIYIQPFDSSALIPCILTVFAVSFQQVALFSILNGRKIPRSYIWFVLLAGTSAAMIVRHVIFTFISPFRTACGNLCFSQLSIYIIDCYNYIYNYIYI